MESQTNEWKEEEIEKEAERISEKRKGNSKTSDGHNQKSEWDSKGMDKLFQNRNDETIYRRFRKMVEAQNTSDCYETVEKTKNYL